MYPVTLYNKKSIIRYNKNCYIAQVTMHYTTVPQSLVSRQLGSRQGHQSETSRSISSHLIGQSFMKKKSVRKKLEWLGK